MHIIIIAAVIDVLLLLMLLLLQLLLLMVPMIPVGATVRRHLVILSVLNMSQITTLPVRHLWHNHCEGRRCSRLRIKSGRYWQNYLAILGVEALNLFESCTQLLNSLLKLNILMY